MANVVSPVGQHLPWPASAPNAQLYESGGWTVLSAGDLYVGSRDHAGAINVLAAAKDGERAYGFADDFYNAIYFIPDPVNFATVDRETTNTFFVWNAYSVAQTLTEIAEANFDGLTFSAPTLPLEFAAYQLIQFQLTAAEAGPINFESTLTFTFTGLDDRVLLITGSRAVPFFFKPNWSAPVRRTYEFNTAIGRSRNGREQRRQLRSVPRVGLEYRHNGLTRLKVRELLQRVSQNPQTPAAVPDWPYRRKMNAVSSGTTQFSFATVPFWMNDGSVLFLVSPDHETFQILQIDTITGFNVNLASAVSEDYPAGSYLYKGFLARPRLPTEVEFLSSSVGNARLSFEVDPGQEDMGDYGSAEATFDGREVMTFVEDWSSPPRVSFDKDLKRYDPGQGQISIVAPTDFTEETWQLNFTGFTVEEINSLENFFLRHAGKCREFWRSTRQDDISVRERIDTEGTFIKAEGLDIFRTYADDPTHRAVEIERNDGTFFRARVTSIEEGEDLIGLFSRLNLSTEAGEDVELEDIKRASWLLLCTFASDAASFEYLTDGKALSSLPVRSTYVEDDDE